MWFSNNYSDWLVLTEGRCRKNQERQQITIPAIVKSNWIRTSEKTVRRVSEPVIVKHKQILIVD